jgi:hypothetical protein
MKTISIRERLPFSARKVWEVISDVERCDWVPAVENIKLDGDVRSFTMEGVGEVQEKIIKKDTERMVLQYSAIKTPSQVEHHLATISITEENEGCEFEWVSEISPDQFSEAIRSGMGISFQGLIKVLSS